MDKLAEKDESTPEKRSVRRRLVQSTLIPQKPQEIEYNDGDHNVVRDCEVIAEDEDSQGFCCGSQGKKTRKQKAKTTPPAIKAPKKFKERSPKKATPKKNGKILKNSVDGDDPSPPFIPNLRVEAKLKAEEYSRMFTAKQLHPFFSSWKIEKKNQNGKEVDGNYSSSGRKDKSNTIGPIHVFDRSQDEVLSVDWTKWTFYEVTVDKLSCLEGRIPLVFNGSLEPIELDKLSRVPYPNNTSSDPYQSEANWNENRSEVPVLIVDDQELCCKPDHQLEQIASVSEHVGPMKKSEAEEKSSSVQGRTMSHSNGCAHRSADSLWTDKYRPKNAMEICGNTESVKFMSDWLHIWHERDVQAFKDSSGSDRCGVPDYIHGCSLIDSDPENVDEGNSLKNVLLVTGPIGSGKSAAIHVCANERGFKVLENNASDCRQGSIVKQKFGGALESNCLKRSTGNPVDSSTKGIIKSSQASSNGEAAQQVDDNEIKVLHISDDENSHGVIEKLDNHVKPLILIEDVDVFFPEDRGFVAAIQQIAEKAKGPVILTSNSNNTTLPDSLETRKVSFTLPTPKDLLSHLYMICAAEKVDLQPHLLEQLIESCQADIRKTIMHLQFWCQNKRDGKVKEMLTMCSSEIFDPEAGHCVLPKIIPWDFASQLSELVDKEIMKSLSLMEENSTIREVADGVEAKKEEMLSRNFSVRTSNDLEDPFSTACERSNFPRTPVSFSRRRTRRKFNVIASSDSEDENLFHNNAQVVAERDTNNELPTDSQSSFPYPFTNTQNCLSPSIDKHKLLRPDAENLEENCFMCSEVQNDLNIGTCKSVEISYVPESSFVPETEIDHEAVSLSGTACSGYVTKTVEVSVASEFDLNLPPVEDETNNVLKSQRNPYLLENVCDVAAHDEEVEDSQSEHAEAVSRTYQVMDECSRMEFKRSAKPMEVHSSSEAIDLVKESWKKLRGSNTDLRHYVSLEKPDALQILKHTHGICDLICEADRLLSKCQTLDVSGLSMFPHEDLDACNSLDEQLKMTSTIAQLGFSFHVKVVSDHGSKMDSNPTINLTWDMLACTNTRMSVKLWEQDLKANAILGDIPLEREMKSRLFDRVKSLVPSRSYLALNGFAFHEYLSSLGCMLRSEASRLSESSNQAKKRRGRGSRHYLSTSALMLSPDDISVLVQSNSYWKGSSQSKDVIVLDK